MAEYHFHTRVGLFRLVKGTDGRWSIWLNDQRFTAPSAYATAAQAASDLAGGHCDWPDCGDPSRFSIPDNLNEWNKRQ